MNNELRQREEEIWEGSVCKKYFDEFKYRFEKEFGYDMGREGIKDTLTQHIVKSVHVNILVRKLRDKYGISSNIHFEEEFETIKKVCLNFNRCSKEERKVLYGYILDKLILATRKHSPRFQRNAKEILTKIAEERWQICATCGNRWVENRCGSCREFFYCNRECQRKHWREHKNMCKLHCLYNEYEPTDREAIRVHPIFLLVLFKKERERFEKKLRDTESHLFRSYAQYIRDTF